jgi:hypothetical protein
MVLMHPRQHATGLQRLEAARYALLRRLSSVLRHQMLVHLQPIDMAAQVLGRRLRADTPDLDRVALDLDKVQDFAREAVAANLDAIAWLAPEARQQVALDTAIAECVTTLRGHFSVRGFHLRQVAGSTAPVPRAALRPLLAAVLFVLTDASPAPAEVTIAADSAPAGPVVHVQVQARPGGEAVDGPADYRPLAWEEVEAIARADGVALMREAGAIHLHLPAAHPDA